MVMGDLDTLPGCMGFFGSPMRPNECNVCDVQELCVKTSNDIIFFQLLSLRAELKKIRMELEAIAR